MNLKLEALKAVLFFALGGFIFVHYWPKPEPAASVKKEEQKKGTIKRDIKVFPDGSKDISEVENYDQSSKSSVSASNPPDNFIVLSDLKKSAEVIYRPFDRLPLQTSIDHDISNHETKLKVGISFRF